MKVTRVDNINGELIWNEVEVSELSNEDLIEQHELLATSMDLWTNEKEEEDFNAMKAEILRRMRG